MTLAIIVALPFAAIFFGGLALVWCACERFLAFVRKSVDE